jgi:translocation and assembly module TamA
MSDASSSGTTGCFVPNARTNPAVLVCLLFWLCCALPLHAAEPLEIVVTGIEGDALKNVQGVLAAPVGLVREGTVDKLWLERFARQAKETIQTALEPFGYYNAQITVTTEQVETQYRLLATIVPGKPVQVQSVTVSVVGAGHGEKPLLALIAAFPLQKGSVLLHQSYETAKAALQTQAQELGYLDAEFTRHEIRVAPSATTATIELVLDTGEQSFFGATTIKGAPDYPDRFLRRHLTYKAGEVFSYARLGETQRNFANSERFKTILVTPDKENAEDSRVPVTIQLKAGPRISLRPGIGYGTDTGARFTVRYRDLNLFHLGHEWYTNLFIAERLQGLVTGYVLPGAEDVRNSTTLQLNLQQEDTNAYFSRILALELDRNRSLGAGKLGTLYLKAQYEEYSVANQQATARLLLPGLRFSEQQYDNPARPGRGFSYSVELRGTHQLLGSNTALLQILAEGKQIQPLPWRLSLRTRAQAGATMLHDPINDIPPSLRFFTGGDQSVRGYSYKSLGPRDASGKVVGGTQLLTSSIELERALFQDWGVSLFYDAGNSFNSLSSLKLLQGAGIGLHYYTSLGALNLSVASPLGVDTPSIHLHFTVGFEL